MAGAAGAGLISAVPADAAGGTVSMLPDFPAGQGWLPGTVPANPVDVSQAGIESELDELKEQVVYLENALEYARKRIAELEKKE